MAIPKGGPFATFLIIGTTCFFLGILFASFPYDYYVLWATPPSTLPAYPALAPDPLDPTDMSALRAPYINILEHHLKFMHASPPLISRILHIAIGTGLAGLLAKLYKPTEANMLFDGASLVLYMCGITVYITNLVKGMRVATAGTYGEVGADLKASRFSDANAEMQAEIKAGASPEGRYIGREDSLRVMAASNTILALVLIGVLILQAGQWYAEKKEESELAEMDRVAKAKKAEKSGSGGSVSTAVSSGADAGGSEGKGGRKRQ